jgi:acyl dehydratase
MPVRSDAVGHRTEAVVDVDARWLLAYAAGLGFDPDLCLDDARDGGVVVPPTFCSGLEWVLAGDPARAEILGLTQQERIRGVHAAQDTTFHRPFRAGSKVRVTSEIRYMRRTRAGTMILARIDTADAASGMLLTETWMTSIIRAVDCDAAEAGCAPPHLDTRPPPPDASAARAEVRTDRGLPHIYSECARIWNPIHTERAVALAAGLPDIILHGSATWALAGREVVRARAGGDVRRLRRLAGRFRAPVMAGGLVAVLHTQAQDGSVAFTVETDGGGLAMIDGLVDLAD